MPNRDLAKLGDTLLEFLGDTRLIDLIANFISLALDAEVGYSLPDAGGKGSLQGCSAAGLQLQTLTDSS
jgi:hypothetical protein